MNKLIGTVRNLPRGLDLRSLHRYLKDIPFRTSVGFRCLYPDKSLNYPINAIGFLLVTRVNKAMELTYATAEATYVSGIIQLDNTTHLKEIPWLQLADGRHKVGSNNVSMDRLSILTDTEIKELIDKYILPFDDKALWEALADKLTKERMDLYTTSWDPNIERSNGTTLGTDRGMIVTNHNVIAGTTNGDPTSGLKVLLRNGSMVMAANSQLRPVIYGHQFEGDTRITGNGKMVIRCQHRPVLSTFGEITQDKNREVALRVDLRWKLFYNGRQGIKDMSYPAHAREVLVQLYTDVGGRIHRNNAGALWRDELYAEFEPMHFIRGVYNVVNQDSGFCYHHSDATIHIRHIGGDHINNGRAYRTKIENNGPIGQGPHSAYDHYPSIRRVWWR